VLESEVQEDWRRSCSHVSFSCREGTGDMRAALFLTWSFDGSSSFHLVIHGPRLQTHTLSLSASLHPHLFTRCIMHAWRLARTGRARALPRTAVPAASDPYVRRLRPVFSVLQLVCICRTYSTRTFLGMCCSVVHSCIRVTG